jgi:hypothetical protein
VIERAEVDMEGGRDAIDEAVGLLVARPLRADVPEGLRRYGRIELWPEWRDASVWPLPSGLYLTTRFQYRGDYPQEASQPLRTTEGLVVAPRAALELGLAEIIRRLKT